NTVIDEFRRDRNRKEHETMELPIEENHNASAVNDHLREIEAEAFERMLQSLPPMSRNVFNLFAIDGYSHAEIAEMLTISTGTSKWHVSNARQLLQKALIEHASHKATVR